MRVGRGFVMICLASAVVSFAVCYGAVRLGIHVVNKHRMATVGKVSEVKIPGEDLIRVTRDEAGDFQGTVIEILPINDVPWMVGLKVGRLLGGSSYVAVSGFGTPGKIRVGDKVGCVSIQTRTVDRSPTHFCSPATPIRPDLMRLLGIGNVG